LSATRRHEPRRDERTRPSARRSEPIEAEGSLIPGTRRKVASSPDKAEAGQHCQMTWRPARVLRAYTERCAMCRLHHAELLDAAHIIPDGEPRGDAVVPNGLSLCKIHHAAYDANILGVRPDLVVEVAPHMLEEADGPMLTHGLQGMGGARLLIPRERAARPDPERLEHRYEQFLAAS
jgi:putative restriction endonuclease